LGTALTIYLEFVGYDFVSLRSALPIGKGTDVYEDLLAATIGSDEAEAFVILPRGNATLIAHSDWIKGLTFEFTGLARLYAQGPVE
jgi:hypothetical protein